MSASYHSNEKFRNLSLDLRSLALFRIGIALLLLADLWQRSSDLVAHYSDLGVLPHGLLQQIYGTEPRPSFYLWNGSPLFAAFLFTVTALAYLALLLGFRTRWTTFFSWVMLLALHNRDPLVLDAGDNILRLVLFWSLFLPLGARFSVDQALSKANLVKSNEDETAIERVSSYASVAFILQIGFIYFFSALMKNQPMWTVDRSAIYYTLRLDQFATPQGTWLLSYPQFLRPLTTCVLYLELLGPILLLLLSARTWPRTLLVFVFVAFHIGLALCLSIALFACISVVSWLALLPSAFWLTALRWFRLRHTVSIYYDADCAFCRCTVFLLCEMLCLPVSWVQPAQDQPEVYSELKKHNSWIVVDDQGHQWSGFRAFLALLEVRPFFDAFRLFLKLPLLTRCGEAFYRFVAKRRIIFSRFTFPSPGQAPSLRLSWFEQGVVLFFLIYVTLWNVQNLNPGRFSHIVPPETRVMVSLTGVDQKWGMFAPPPRTDGWMVVEARQRNGKEVDLFRGGRLLSWQKPSSVPAIYPNQRWRRYIETITAKSNLSDAYRLSYALFLHQSWNQTHSPDQQIDTIRMYFFEETNLPDGTNSTPRKILLGSYKYPKS